MSLGKNIRELRLELGKTQKELAQMLDISKSYMSEIESNKRNPSIETVSKLAEKLDVSTIYLLEGKKTLSDMEKAGEKIPLMESRTLEERERIESVISYTRNFLENFNDYETLDVWAINNLFRNLETLKANDKNNPQLGEQTRDFLTVFLQDLNKKIKNNPDSDLNNLYKEILELLNS